MKILNTKLGNFNKKLDNLLLKRKIKVQTSSTSVIKIINDVKKNGDKALSKYEKFQTTIRFVLLQVHVS